MILTPEDIQFIRNNKDRIVTASVMQQPAGIKPHTFIASGGAARLLFSEQPRTRELLKKWQSIYLTGGLYANAIDVYAHAVFANGYRLEGPEHLVQEVEDNFAIFDFDTIGMQGIIQSLVFGDSVQEVVHTRKATGIPAGIVLRDSSTFDIDTDDFGVIRAFRQVIPDRPVVTLEPSRVVHLQLIPSCDVYGISLIGRAYDDIMRDAKTAEASSAAIERHGFKKWHIKVGQPGEIIDDSVIKSVANEFEDIETDNEFTTTADVNIMPLDSGGLEKIEDYNNISLMRVAASLGVPEEMLGIRRGSTDATAVSRMEMFLNTRISAIQRTVARTYTLSYIDQIVAPGAVKLVFSDVREEDEFKKAEWIGKLLGSLSNANPEVLPKVLEIFPKKWIQSQFNITGGQ